MASTATWTGSEPTRQRWRFCPSPGNLPSLSSAAHWPMKVKGGGATLDHDHKSQRWWVGWRFGCFCVVSEIEINSFPCVEQNVEWPGGVTPTLEENWWFGGPWREWRGAREQAGVGSALQNFGTSVNSGPWWVTLAEGLNLLFSSDWGSKVKSKLSHFGLPSLDPNELGWTHSRILDHFQSKEVFFFCQRTEKVERIVFFLFSY